MLRGYRGIVAALVGWLILAAGNPPAQQTQNQPAAKQTEAPPPSYAPYPNLNEEACYQAKDHDSADLCAQWRAAIAAEKSAKQAEDATRWSIVATVLSGIGLAALIYTLIQTERALGEARKGNRLNMKANARATRQAIAGGEHTAEALRYSRESAAAGERAAAAALKSFEHAREASELELRPWLSINAQLGSDVTFDKRGLTFSAIITVKNVGRSVAQQVWVTPEAVALPDARAAEAFFAERRKIDVREGLNNLLVPNESTVGNFFVLVEPEKLDRISDPNWSLPGLYVSVIYMTLKGDRILQTGRTFSLTRFDRSRGRSMAFDRTVQIVPVTEAGITEFPLGGDYVA